MSRLSDREFRAMNNPWRRLFQRLCEFPLLKWFGVPITDREVLEVGCGSGYGAQLLATLKPRSYVGFDFMPEQVDLARKRMPEAEFYVQDATAMKDISTASKDTVVVFGVLHHIPKWKAAVNEIARILRPGGEVYLEEPDGGVIDWFDRFFEWGHPVTFRLGELEAYLQVSGFRIIRRLRSVGFGIYRLQKAG
jgi:ubiquinone/menaquinone biosynthesis C-methylase UbiE